MGKLILNCLANIEIQNWISIIAIIVSILSMFFQICSERKTRIRTESALLYKEAYKKSLMEDIPLAKNEIKFVDLRITGTDNFIECLNSIRRKSYFFKNYDEKFCEKIKKYTQGLEDYIMESEVKIRDKDGYSKFEDELDSKLKYIYALVIKKFKV